MSDIQVISTTKDGTKIGEFNIKNSFLEQKVSPYIPVKRDKDTSKIDALLKHMSVPFGLVYLQTYGSHQNQTPLEEFENMNIHDVSKQLHKLNTYNDNNSGIINNNNNNNNNSGIINNNNNNNSGIINNNEHVADSKVMEQSLCDRLLGVVKEYEKEKKREEKKRENKKLTRKIYHNKNAHKNNKNNKNNKNKNTRKNNKKIKNLK